MPTRQFSILFDNQVFRKIVDGSPFFSKSLYASRLNRFIGNVSLPPYQRIMTPFGVIEALGIRIQQRPKIIHDKKLSIASNVSNAFNSSVSYFSSQHYLSIFNLKLKFEEQLQYWKPDRITQSFINDTLGRALHQQIFPSLLYDWLAFDHILTISDWPGDRTEVNKKLLIEGLMANNQGRELPLFRLMYRIYLEMEELARKKRMRISPRPFKMKSREDLLDADIVHFPIFGTSSSPKSRVIALTEDDLTEIMAKLKWAKTVVTHIKKITPKKFRGLLPKPAYGIVLVIDPQSAQLKKCIHLQQIREHK